MSKWLYGVVLFAPGCIIVEDDSKPTDTGGPTTGDDDDDTGTPPDPLDIDDDGDGVSENDGDCNDTDPAINPSALEICDTIDNNCNSATDDEAAATLNGANHATIDEAVAAAVADEVIEVCPGDWPVTSLNPAVSITLHSVSGVDVTSLHEETGLAVIALTDANTLTIDGITLTGAVNAAVDLQDTSSLSLKNSRVTANGRGINILGNNVTLSIESSTIDANDAGNGDGGGIAAEGGFTISLVDSSIAGNNAANGGGIFGRVLFGIGTIDLVTSTVESNTANVGGGAVLQNVTLTGDVSSSFTGNTASLAGGGVAMYRSSIASVLVSTNDAPAGGGVAALYDPDFLLAPLLNPMLGVVIDSNTADLGAGIWIDDGETASVDAYSAVTLNTAATNGGGAYLDGDDSVFDSFGANFGDPKLGNDNTPEDIYAAGSSFTYLPGDVFSCTGSGGCTGP